MASKGSKWLWDDDVLEIQWYETLHTQTIWFLIIQIKCKTNCYLHTRLLSFTTEILYKLSFVTNTQVFYYYITL